MNAHAAEKRTNASAFVSLRAKSTQNYAYLYAYVYAYYFYAKQKLLPDKEFD